MFCRVRQLTSPLFGRQSGTFLELFHNFPPQPGSFCLCKVMINCVIVCEARGQPGLFLEAFPVCQSQA